MSNPKHGTWWRPTLPTTFPGEFFNDHAGCRALDARDAELRRLRPVEERRTISIDFDGVIHSYVSGWRGATVIPDPPVAGAIEWLRRAQERFDVVICSARAREPGGAEAISAYLRAHGIDFDPPVTAEKPQAVVYLDDRAWRFDGAFPALDAIAAFEPWMRAATAARGDSNG